ncbi:flagellar biosynthesis protein FlhB [Govanella unica]|uniref:Flagellar biosynthetic protein FlhB n=1 Tax=Govanella unica TaxID=2975056 RepID=A0A9X3TWI4_9PROT|nr:flagellar biosynthesis protein FlhB [Govania unica]MDA5193236.1 flagellar biosynthesis protein FlhB [Govania unica]
MADDQDDSQKTEEPSDKKLDEAMKRGNVVSSREVTHWFMLMAMALAINISSGDIALRLRGAFVSFFDTADQLSVDPGNLMGLYKWILLLLASTMLLPFGILMAGSIVGSLIQHRPVISAEKLKMSLSKISPIAGFKRIFGMQNVVEILKTIAKLIIIGSVVTALVMPEASRLDQSMTQSLEDILPYVKKLTIKLLTAVISIMFVLAIADYFYQYMSHRKKLRMSKQEMKDEYKQSDGDPHVKGRLRQIRMERSRKRMMQAVPGASVVITNPTHYAVALKYEHGGGGAPMVVAKGADLIALKIREIAKEHKVPIVENAPLARALFASVEVDQEIPQDHYRAVAEVIGFVMKLRQK